jgi:hypothetical protein
MTMAKLLRKLIAEIEARMVTKNVRLPVNNFAKRFEFLSELNEDDHTPDVVLAWP